MKVNPTFAILAAVAIGYTACTSQMAHDTEGERQDADPAVVTTTQAAPPTSPEVLREAVYASRKAAGGLVQADAVRNELPGRYNPNFNTENYSHISENPFLSVAVNPLSTFSIDVDRASYSNIRRFINQGQRPPIDAVRIEEMINYFSYDYPGPEDDRPFSITTEVAPAPWNQIHRLVRIGIQGLQVDTDDLPPSNLVFLIDVSGSMQSPDKLPLLKSAFRMLVNELRAEDRVAMVVYAGAAGLVLPSTPGDQKDKILDALLGLEAGGSTAGGEGIRLAYDVARENHIAGGNNRVILATDGDFNVGPSSDSEMVRLIEEKRRQGTFLTVLGFGTGNLQDSKMEKLADHGNGNFAYIDNLTEARKVLVEEIGGTLLTIAKDVKIQVEFNPTRVAAYRLIGYENRLLRDEDFNDDTKDAGELGAGHSVTALYEVVPVGVDTPVQAQGVDSLRYQSGREQRSPSDSDELLYVKLRYKEPDGATSKLLTQPVIDVSDTASSDLRFVTAVAGFGMLLRASEYSGEFTLTDVVELAQSALGEDRGGYRAEFIKLVEAVRSMELLRETVAE
jgi:Ca-activated chloride channel family protein